MGGISDARRNVKLKPWLPAIRAVFEAPREREDGHAVLGCGGLRRKDKNRCYHEAVRFVHAAMTATTWPGRKRLLVLAHVTVVHEVIPRIARPARPQSAHFLDSKAAMPLPHLDSSACIAVPDGNDDTDGKSGGYPCRSALTRAR
jgi:hypothetical protein